MLSNWGFIVMLYGFLFLLLCGWILTVFKDALVTTAIIQLKEYRRDKIYDFFKSREGKNFLLRKQLWIRVLFVVCGLAMLLRMDDLKRYLFLFLIEAIYFFAEGVYFIVQVWKKKLRLPVVTGRSVLLIGAALLVIIYGTHRLFVGVGTWFFFPVVFAFTALLAWGVTLMVWLLSNPLFEVIKRRLYGQARRKLMQYPALQRVGVSGSYGKSSVKNFLAALLATEFLVKNPPANINSDTGVSNFLKATNFEGVDYFVTEYGTYCKGETALLGSIVDHSIGFLTGLNMQHVGLFGSMDNVIAAEGEIMEKLVENNGTLYCNWDDKIVQGVDYPEGITVVRYGTQPGGDAVLEVVERNGQMTTCSLEYQNSSYTFTTNAIGDHTLVNLCGAIACCLDQGVGIDAMQPVLATIQSQQKTFHVHELDNMLVIDDTYNINENGIIAGVDAATQMGDKTVVFVDDILELGVHAESVHYDIGEHIASLGVDHFVLIGKEFASFLRDGMIAGGVDPQQIITTLPRSYEAIHALCAGSVVLFLGRFTKPYMELLLDNKCENEL